MSANIFHGDVIHFARKSKSCEEAATDVEKIFRGKIQSAIFIPLTIGKQVFGFLCFGTSDPGRLIGPSRSMIGYALLPM